MKYIKGKVKNEICKKENRANEVKTVENKSTKCTLKALNPLLSDLHQHLQSFRRLPKSP